MKHDFLDRYSRLASPIHRLAAGVKLVCALAMVVMIVVTPGRFWPVFAGIAGLLLAVAVLSTIPPRFLVRRLVLLEPFVLGVAILTLFQPGGGRIFASIFVRSTLCLCTMILMANTTPFSEILRVLRAIHTPPLLVTTLALMYRYLFVLIDQTQRMRRARLSRTFTDHRWHAWHSLGNLVGQLFVRTSERAERVYAAMCARGWK